MCCGVLGDGSGSAVSIDGSLGSALCGGLGCCGALGGGGLGSSGLGGGGGLDGRLGGGLGGGLGGLGSIWVEYELGCIGLGCGLGGGLDGRIGGGPGGRLCGENVQSTKFSEVGRVHRWGARGRRARAAAHFPTQFACVGHGGRHQRSATALKATDTCNELLAEGAAGAGAPPASLRALAPAWAAALARALVWRAGEAVADGRETLGLSETLWAAVALGVGWADSGEEGLAGARAAEQLGWPAAARTGAATAVAAAVHPGVRALLSSSTLLDALAGPQGDSESDALLVIATLRPPPPAPALGATAAAAVHEAAAGALRQLVGALRVSGRTAYVAALGSMAAAPAATQALALRALAAATAAGAFVPVELVPRLAMVVAGGDGAGGGGGGWRYGGWGGDGATSALRLIALCAYDVATGSAAPNLRFEALSGTSPLLRAAFVDSAGGRRAARISLPWEALSALSAHAAPAIAGVANVARLQQQPAGAAQSGLLFFLARGTGRLGVAVELDGGALGGTLVRGTLVEVAISVTSADGAEGLVLEDRPPAGLEPLDPAVYGEQAAPAGQGAVPCPRWLGRWGGWGGCAPAFERDMSPSLVRGRARWLGADTHTLTYTATVATSGDFVLAPAHAYAAAQPELMGLSAAGRLAVVVFASAATAAPVTAAEPPRGCADMECGGHGTCDVVLGACVASCVEPWPAGAGGGPTGLRGGVRLRFGLAPIERIADDATEPAAVAYAFSSDERVVPSSRLELDAASGSLTIAPASPGEAGSAYVTLAASHDGAQLRSKVLLVSIAENGSVRAPLELRDEGALAQTAGQAGAASAPCSGRGSGEGTPPATSGRVVGKLEVMCAGALVFCSATVLGALLIRRRQLRGKGFVRLGQRTQPPASEHAGASEACYDSVAVNGPVDAGVVKTFKTKKETIKKEAVERIKKNIELKQENETALKHKDETIALLKLKIEWSSDCAKESQQRHTRRSRPADPERDIKAAVALLFKGKFSDAAKLLESHGLAAISDPIVLQQMLTEHPRRRTAMPPVILGLDATDRLVVGISEMQESYRGLKTDKAQGA
ncbi:hypothetical protein T492DRAFT_875061, partial [Pavlovales sp. CCMP2436]